MIILKVNIESVFTFKCECDTPVAANANTPGAGAIAFQLVQSIAREIHICCCPRVVQHVQLSA